MTNYSRLYTAAKKAGKVEDITPDYVKLENKGDQVVGVFVSMNSVNSSLSGGVYNQYLFETDKGLQKFHMGSSADAEFSAMFISGELYAITYEGKEQLKGGRSVNRYTVEHVDITGVTLEDEQKPAENGKSKHKA
jgi:hypothetical protein